MSHRCILLFDIDGTLLLSGGSGNRSLDKALKKITGRDGGMTEVTPDGKTDSLIIEEAFRVNFPDLSFSPDAIEKTLKYYLEFLEEDVRTSEKFHLMPGIPELLDRCRDEGHLLGLATGNIVEGANIKLRRAGLESYFSFGGFGSDASDRAEMTRIAVRKGRKIAGSEVPGKNIFVIGDTPHDIICAKEAEVCSIGVGAARYSCEELAHYHPDFLLNDLSNPEDFLKILRSVNI